jgi:hypothetical protein
LSIIIILFISTTGLDLTFNSVIASNSLPFKVYRSAYSAYAEDPANNIGNSYMNFGYPINLTNNTRDSVYAQISAYRNNVYVVWEEQTVAATNTNTISNNNKENIITRGYTNYDIYFKKSTDGGVTFSKAINISTNPGFSQHPQIAVSGSNVYLAWTDDTSYNKEILFRMSSDEGNSFGRTIKLSDGIGESYNQEISSYGNNVYVVWENKYDNTNHVKITGDTNTIGISDNVNKTSYVRDAYGINNKRILFKASTDGGNSFKNAEDITTNLGGIADLYPKIAASQNDVYLTWSVGMPASRVEDTISGYGNNNNSNNDNIEEKQGIYFTKSYDNGGTFTNAVKLNSEAGRAGESQIAASGNQVYIVWSGNSDSLIPNDLYFMKSTDNGKSFTAESSLSKKSSLNAELAIDGNNVYIIWQDFLTPDNQEILIKKSTDSGNTFTYTSTNISNNKGTSECPSIVISKNIIYAIWEDDTPGNHEIYFSRGSNNHTVF